MRFGLEMADVSEVVRDCGFKIFSSTVADGGMVKALHVPDVRPAPIFATSAAKFQLEGTPHSSTDALVCRASG